MWRVSSDADRTRFVAWGENGLEGDERTLQDLEEAVDSAARAPLTVTGPYRDVENLGDEVGVFAFAVAGIVPRPFTITGTPPRGEPAAVPEDATP